MLDENIVFQSYQGILNYVNLKLFLVVLQANLHQE